MTGSVSAPPQGSAGPSRPAPQLQARLTGGSGGRLRPSRTGLGFLLALLLTLVGCINYDLSLGYALTFLLAGVWVTGTAFALRQAREVEVRLRPPARAVAGGGAEYQLELRRQGQGLPFRLEVTAAGGAQVLTFPAQAEAVIFPWVLPVAVRGVHDPQAHLTLYDPLGLWQVTRDLRPLQPLLVWPRPEAHPPAPPLEALAGSGDSVRRVRGDQELSGLRPYVPGDATRRIFWRRSAGREELPGGGLLVREQDAPAAMTAALDWDRLSLPPEARAARLAGWIEELSAAGQPFSLTLPGARLETASSEAHRQRALSALARVEPLPEAPPPESIRPQLAAWRGRILPHAWPWTLLAVAWVLLPTVTRAPVWVTAFSAALLGYAYWRERQPTPPLSPSMTANILAVLAVLVLGGLYLSYGTLVGLDPSTALLTLLLALKVAESRSVRDGVLVVLLAFFVALTHFLHSMSPLQALHVLISAVLLLGALHLWSLPSRGGGPAPAPAAPEPQRAGAAPHPAAPPAWQAGLRLALTSLPLMLALFLFFPRPSGPLWRFPGQSGAGTGLSNSVEPGDVTHLAQSNNLAFRATFEGPVPPKAELYWRGPVYEAFDGRSWRVVRPKEAAIPDVTVTGPTYRYSVLQEPSDLAWVLALETVQTVPQGVTIASNLSALDTRPPTGRSTRYALSSAASRTGVREMQGRLNYNLQYPEGQNPQTLALVKSWRSLPPAQRVREGLNYFASGAFTYTLTPPALPENNRIDAFLFGTRAGFCEHFASAFGLMMRAAGVPTRMVGGYQGGEVVPGSQTVTVRQLSAHVWDEVWLEGQGWVRVDPTAAAAPARISTDLQTALSDPNASTVQRSAGFWQSLTSVYDTLQVQWYDLIVSFDEEKQAGALSDLGFGRVGGSRYWVGFAGLLLLALLPMLLLWRGRSRPADPAARALDDLTRRLGLPRPAGEPAGTYAQRAAAEYPALRPQLEEIAALYNRLRYGPAPSSDDLQRLQGLVRRVRRS